MTEKSLQVKDQAQEVQASTEPLVHMENASRPAVDIYHTPEAFIFLMDLPGVKQDGIQLELTETNTLVLRARSSFALDLDPVFQQTRLGNYYRAFELGEEVDREQISAKLEAGQLEVRVAKKEAARPRRVEIQVA